METIILAILSLMVPFGEIMSFSLYGMRVRAIDLLVLLYVLIFVITQRKIFVTTLIHNPLFLLSGALVVSALGNVGHANSLSLAYLARSLLYFSFFGLAITKKDTNLKKYLSIGLGLLIIASMAQYLWYPNLRNLLYAGYDPHLGRLVGPFLDPNLLGLAFVLYGMLFFPWSATVLIPFLLLTYSRISIATFVIAMGYRNKLIGIIFLVLIFAALFFLPRNEGVGTNLLRGNSIRSKGENIRYSYTLWQRNPLLGIGFNTLPSQKSSAFPYPDNSRFGIDNSILTLFTTTGILGIGAYGYALYLLWRRFSSPAAHALTLAFTVHSISVNSLFTPSLFVLYTLCLISCTQPFVLPWLHFPPRRKQ